MKTKFKKIITTIILIVMLLNNMTIKCFADEENVLGINEDGIFGEILGTGLDAVDGIIGVITTKVRVIVVAIGAAVQGLTSILGHIDGASVEDGNEKAKIMITVEEIFFNKLNITKINFFDMDSSTAGSISSKFREGIATWYYVLRSLAIIILLCILIYVGIRMAISTVASEKAMYKNMLKDWLVSFILVFFMHYIIVVTIQVNNSLVNILANGIKDGNSWGAEYMNTLFINAIGIDPEGGLHQFSLLKSWSSTIVYIMMIFFTLVFLWTYIKRMITLAFLIIISPLVTVTYAIDKMGDGKSQALNAWLKEFVYNVLLQPFHCIIYLALIKSSIELLTNNKASLGLGALVIMCLMFTYEAEKIVRKIFGFDKASSIADSMATTGAMLAGFSALKKIGPKGRMPAGASKLAKAAANSTNSGLAKNKIANKNIARALDAAKNIAAVKAISNVADKVASSSAGKFISQNASKVAEGMKDLKSDIKSSLENSRDNGTPIQKMGANMALAATRSVQKAGEDIKKDIKGAVSSIGNFTRAINGPGAIQSAMTVVGVGVGLTTGNASNAITYGMAGNEIGAKMAAPAQDKYREKQERKLAENYKEIAKSFEELNGNMGDFDLTTEAGRENMKEKCKEITEKGPMAIDREFQEECENYKSTLEDRIRNDHIGDASWTDTDTAREVRREFKDKYNEILNGSMDNITAEIDDLMIRGNFTEAAALENFAITAKEKDLSDNLNRMMGIESALGDEESEKTVVTGKNSTIDRINAGLLD